MHDLLICRDTDRQWNLIVDLLVCTCMTASLLGLALLANLVDLKTCMHNPFVNDTAAYVMFVLV